MSDPAYEIRQVATAVGIPERRLEGWVERGVVIPSIPPRGSGTRSLFSAGDVLQIGILAELQALFGPELRPGGLATALRGERAWLVPFLDHVALTPADRRDPVILCVHGGPDGPTVSSVRSPEAAQVSSQAPVVLWIDAGALWTRISRSLPPLGAPRGGDGIRVALARRRPGSGAGRPVAGTRENPA